MIRRLVWGYGSLRKKMNRNKRRDFTFNLEPLTLNGRRSSAGFTLVELLVVIGIIAALAGIILPVIQTSIGKAEKMTAEGDVKRLVTAWEKYYAEYGSWLCLDDRNQLREIPKWWGGEEGMSPNEAETQWVLRTTENVVEILTTRFEEADFDNPKTIKFMTFGPDALNEDGDFVDPWGNPYRFLFDLNGDGKVERPGFEPIYKKVIAWSMGPDGQDADSDTADEVKDNINSWK
jgi:prepilin-type N-terminal cleavage/methylation domain-containing protein